MPSPASGSTPSRRGARYGLAEADRGRQGRTRFQGEQDQRRDAAGLGRQPYRRAPLAGADHPTVRAALTELAVLYGVEPDFSDVDGLLTKLGTAAALVEPVIRNSANPTMLEAYYKINVIPGHAIAHVDGRVLPGGEEEFATTMDELVSPDVKWEYHHREIPLEAPVDSPVFGAMREALLHFDPGAHVVPFVMGGGTDAKQFSRLGITGYGFSPLKLPEGFDYAGMYHGVDERVPVDGLHFGVRVLDRFLLGTHTPATGGER